LWLHSLKVAQLLRSAACLHTNQSRSYLNHLVFRTNISSNINIVVRIGGKLKTFQNLAELKHEQIDQINDIIK